MTTFSSNSLASSLEHQRRVWIVECQIYVIIILNCILYLLGFMMYVAASGQQSAQYTIQVEIWLILTYIADFLSLLATAWIAVLFNYRDLVSESRFAEQPFLNGLFTLLFVQTTVYAVLATNITFVYLYVSKDVRYLDLLNQGFQVSGSFSFIERRLDLFLTTIIWNNSVPSVLVLMLYFVQTTVKHYATPKEKERDKQKDNKEKEKRRLLPTPIAMGPRYYSDLGSTM